jgi:hypothetical protein
MRSVPAEVIKSTLQVFRDLFLAPPSSSSRLKKRHKREQPKKQGRQRGGAPPKKRQKHDHQQSERGQPQKRQPKGKEKVEQGKLDASLPTAADSQTSNTLPKIRSGARAVTMLLIRAGASCAIQNRYLPLVVWRL